MGPLAAVIFNRIVDMKILSDIQIEGGPMNFLEPVLSYYWQLAAKMDHESK